MCGARPAQTYKSLPRRVGGASRSSCRVLCAQMQPVITLGAGLRGRGSLWRLWLSTPPRKASRTRGHRRRARATASSERASSAVRRPAHWTSPAAIDPASPPPRRADIRASLEDGGEAKKARKGSRQAAGAPPSNAGDAVDPPSGEHGTTLRPPSLPDPSDRAVLPGRRRRVTVARARAPCLCTRAPVSVASAGSVLISTT